MSPVLPIVPSPVPATEPGGASRPRGAARKAQDAGDGTFLLALAPELAASAARPTPVAPLPSGPSPERTSAPSPAGDAVAAQVTQSALLAYAASRGTPSDVAAPGARGASPGRAASGSTARLAFALGAAARLLRAVVKPVAVPADGLPAGDAAPATSTPAAVGADRAAVPAPVAIPADRAAFPAPAAIPADRAAVPAPAAIPADRAAVPAPVAIAADRAAAATPATETTLTVSQATIAAPMVARAGVAVAAAPGPDRAAPSREDGAPSRDLPAARPATGTAIGGAAVAARPHTGADRGDAGTAGRRSPRSYAPRVEPAADAAPGPSAPAVAPVAVSGPAPVRPVPGTTEAGSAWGAAIADAPPDGMSGPRLPAPANQVTLQFTGEEGLEGRLRVALRGNALHATIVARDPDGARQLESGLDELRQALGDRGFTDARVAVQGAAGSRAGEPRPERQEQHASHHEDHADRSGGKRDGDLDSSQGNPRRRSPRRQSER